MAAFTSMAVQADGLIGSHGILPIADYLDRAQGVLGPGLAKYWQLPTLFWLGASDHVLHGICWGGSLLAALLFLGFFPGLCAGLLWVFYLSVVVAGQVFLSYQWDSLLLEAGFLAVLIAPWCIRLGSAGEEPWWFSIWLVRWLAFRLMFESGMVKLTSGDPAWSHFSALDFHYETQPLPVWVSWYFHQLPAWFHRLSVTFMFYAELVAPFFIFGPRLLRRIGFASVVLLQLLIAGTGNYGFFNLLSIVICLSLLDDRDWEWPLGIATARRKDKMSEAKNLPEPSGKWNEWSLPRRVAVGTVGAFIIVATSVEMIERIWPGTLEPHILAATSGLVEPFRSTNAYGLFAVMTSERPEILIEASEDGTSWKAYRFRWKPDDLDRRPLFATPWRATVDHKHGLSGSSESSWKARRKCSRC
jgi:lipase maturation factor 1